MRDPAAINDICSGLMRTDSLGVYYATSDGQILQSNSTFLRTIGYTEADLPLHVDDLTPPEYAALDEAKRNEVHWTGSGMPWQKEYIRRDGTRVAVMVGVSLVDPRQGNCLCFAMDMSGACDPAGQRQQSQAACKEAFDDFQLIYFTIDSAGAIYAINTYGAQRLGYRQEDLLGRPLASLLHVEDRDTQQRQLARAVSCAPELQNCEVRVLRKNDEVLWLNESIRGISGAHNSLAFVVCADVTQQKRANALLERYHKQVRALTAKTVLTEERERRLVAIGLHDRVGHRLAIAKFKAATLMQRNSISPDLKRALADIGEEIDQAIAATRNLTAELSSPTLYDLGLGSALRALGDQITAYDAGLEVSVEPNQLPRAMPQDTIVILHRVVRELLFNVVKHARAKRVAVTTDLSDGHLSLMVTDDGVGISFEELPSPPEGFGLFSIREQVRETGGSFQISPLATGGTRAIVTVPIGERLS